LQTVGNDDKIALGSEGAVMFQMPKGFGLSISEDEFKVIARNILQEHVTQLKICV
jgi:hypothetical protein